MLELKFNKQQFTNFMESLVLRRFANFKEIEDEVYNKTGILIELYFDERWNEEERLEGYDYCLKSNLTVNDEDLCYIDVYFIRDNSNQTLITEINLDFNT